jgi:hypothetical protein
MRSRTGSAASIGSATALIGKAFVAGCISWRMQASGRPLTAEIHSTVIVGVSLRAFFAVILGRLA